MSRRTMKTALVGLLALALTMTGATAATAAPNQNEIVISPLFDGAAAFDESDPRDNGNGQHTPGLDIDANNRVVRSYDSFAVALDWDVNEAAGTNVVLTATLPEFAVWNPDSTGMFSGCLPLPQSSISDDRRTLNCALGDKPEGSHGVVRPTAQLLWAEDNTEFTVSATMTLNGATTVSDALDDDQTMFVSEAPAVNWIKQEPKVSEPIGTGASAYYVLLFPLGLADRSAGDRPAIGSGPLSDSPAMTFFDHMWDFPESARMASEGEFAASGFAGTRCGRYAEGNGAAVPVIPTTTTFTCTGHGKANGNYTVVQMDLAAGYNSDEANYPALNDDGSANKNSIFVSAQLAVRILKSEVDTDTLSNSAKYTNSIGSNPQSAIITSDEEVEPIAVGTDFAESSTVDNTSGVGFSRADNTNPPSGTAPYTNHWATFTRGTPTLQQNEYFGETRFFNTWNFMQQTGSAWRGTAVAPRGTPVMMNLFVAAAVPSGAEELGITRNTPIQGCMAWENTHMYLTPMGDVTVNSEASSTQIAPTGPFSNILSGQIAGAPVLASAQPGFVPWPQSVSDGVQFIVEFANVPTGDSNDPVPGSSSMTRGIDLERNVVTCNQNEADSRGWVNQNDAAGMAQFDQDDDGRYEGINRVRVRVVGEMPWQRVNKDLPIVEMTRYVATSGYMLTLQAAIDTDINNTEKDDTIYLHSGRAVGVWNNPSTQNHAVNSACVPLFSRANYDDELVTPGPDIYNDPAVTGWCSQEYQSSSESNDAAPRPTNLDLAGFTANANNQYTIWADSDHDKVEVIVARPSINKTNVDGLADIADNGQTVDFRIKMGIEGSDQEALGGLVMTDTLQSYYRFDSVVEEPNNAECTYPDVGTSGTITCLLTDPDPAVDTHPDLPQYRVGGYSDEIVIRVTVFGGVATAASFSRLNNTATIDSSYLVPQQGDGSFDVDNAFPAPQSDSSRASSYMPLANDEAFLLKTIDPGVGECEINLLEDDDVSLEDWQSRCSMIKLDTDDSNAETVTDDDGNIRYTVSYSNTGNTVLPNVRFVDVFPYVGDSTEPGSSSGDFGADPSTVGDGRTPTSSFNGQVGYVSMRASSDTDQRPASLAVYLTNASPQDVPRDPEAAWAQVAWCTALGGTPVNGVAGTCPTTNWDVTATFAELGNISPDRSVSLDLVLDTEGARCTDYWTNTFGARNDTMRLPVRSNDVTTMVSCEYDMALRKTVEPDWTPGGDDTAPWLTYNQSTVTFNIEVFNQGDQIEDFDVTDYVDTDYFQFVADDNGPGTTQGPSSTGYTQPETALNYVWEYTAGQDPVAKVTGRLEQNESVVIPITLRVKSLPDGTLDNLAEITRFDNDGDPETGDSDPENPNNGDTPLRDEDSTPDDTSDNDDLVDDVIDSNPEGDPADEDDHDIASVPWYDLALVKDLSSGQNVVLDTTADPVTASFDILVKNQGPNAVSNVTVTDVPPTGLTLSDTTATLQESGDSTITNNGDNTFTIDALAPGAEATFTVVYEVDLVAVAAAGGTVTNNAEISEFFDEAGDPAVDVDSNPDADPTNDSYLDPEGGEEADGGESPDFNGEDDNDLHNRGSADEDDHDREVVSIRYSLGNQVWLDTNNNGTIDDGEEPIEGVTVQLFSATDFDPENSEPLATTVTDENGLYLFSNLPPGDYIVVIPGSNGAAGGPLELMRSSDPTEDDPNTDVDGDDNGIFTGTYVRSGTVTLGGSEPLDENPDNDTNADVLSNLTVDFGFYRPVFDVALRKTLAEGQAEVVNVGDPVTFDITVFNQGDVIADEIQVTDYIPSQLELNDPDWTAVGDDLATIAVEGPLMPGESTVVQITFTVKVGGRIDNYAEVSEQTPVDEQGTPLTDITGTVIPDVDSIPDQENRDVLIDDEINLTPATGDEDDHDIASVRTPPMIEIEKWNTNEGPTDGDHDRDDYTAKANEDVDLTFTITNTGDEAILDVVVSDTTDTGPAIRDLTCDFSALGGPSSGTTWAGPFAVGATFECTAVLPAMGADKRHSNTASVSGIGEQTGDPVGDDDPWNAKTPPEDLNATGGEMAPLLMTGALLILGLGMGLLVVARIRRKREI